MKPRLLDLFCGAGGCTKGYQRSGFYVVGVDVEPQPNYCGDEFIQADALDELHKLTVMDFHRSFDAIHASPPCQAYSTLKRFTEKEYPRLIEPVRDLLEMTGLPYVIENVVGAPLINPIMLCGSSFGLRVWRHRLFELSFLVPLLPPCSHQQHPKPLDVTGTGGPSGKPRVKPGGGLSRKPANLADARGAMGIDWMTRSELAEAIPPAYTEYIGRCLLDQIERERQVAA